MRFWFIHFLCLLWVPLLSAQELWETLPRENRAVHDFADVIAPDREAAMERQLRTVYQSTATPIVVVTLESLEGGQIDDFTNRLYEEWGIGTKPENKGALFLVAIEDRKMRIEVGYGSEPVLTDAYTASLIRNVAAPHFRAGDYGGGIQAVVDRLVEPLETGQTPSVAEPEPSGREGFPEWLIIPGFLVFSLFFRGARRRRGRGGYYRTHGPFVGGGFGGGGYRGGGGGGFGGFGGGFSGGGGASGGW